VPESLAAESAVVVGVALGGKEEEVLVALSHLVAVAVVDLLVQLGLQQQASNVPALPADHHQREWQYTTQPQPLGAR